MVRNILSFVEPTLRITYAELYDELAGHLQVDRDEATRRLAPDDAVAALGYFRRQETRRQEAARLAGLLGVTPSVVFEACTPDGVGKLVRALQASA